MSNLLQRTSHKTIHNQFFLKNIYFYAAILISIFISMPLLTPTAFAGDRETAEDLTTLLRAARSVTVNKKTISDPGKFNIKKFIKKTKKNYQRSSEKNSINRTLCLLN